LGNIPEKQKGEVTALLESFEDIFTDTPGTTTLCSHHINLIPGSKPVSSLPYGLHPDKAIVAEKEIAELFDMGNIKQSDSPWASPIVLVPTPDGSVRLSTDYRKVSKLTLPDPFPLHRVEDLMDRVPNTSQRLI